MSLKFNSEFVLLVAKVTKENFLYFLDLGLDSVLPFCHHLELSYMCSTKQTNQRQYTPPNTTYFRMATVNANTDLI
jgi:hypothetical protein